jgi:hypothetical protein
MFYADVPNFEWLIFGSHGRNQAHAASDLDVAIRFDEGIDANEAIKHPYFTDTLAKLKEFSMPEGVLDLFVVDRAAKNITNVFHPEMDLARGNAEQFDKVSATFTPIPVQRLFKVIGWWNQVAEPRSPIAGFAASLARGESVIPTPAMLASMQDTGSGRANHH